MSAHHKFWAAVVLLLAATLLAGCVVTVSPLPKQPNPPRVRSAFFAPDGKSFYFTFTSQKIHGLFRADLGGKVTAWLYKRRIHEPTISPDGRTLVFAVYTREDKGDLWAMDADGSHLRQLTSDSDYDREPRFSHDGKRIYFLRYDSWGAFPIIDVPKDWDGDVYCLDLATGKTSQITDEKFARARDLFVFPGDRHILLTAPIFEKNGDLLWKISTQDARQRTPVTPNLSQYTDDPMFRFGSPLLLIEDPVLSRDGQYLLFAWQDPKHMGMVGKEIGHQVFVCEMQDMDAKRITNTKDFMSPRDISSDNQWILFAGSASKSYLRGGVLWNGNLWLVKRDGSGLTNLKLDFRGVLQHPPTSGRLP